MPGFMYTSGAYILESQRTARNRDSALKECAPNLAYSKAWHRDSDLKRAGSAALADLEKPSGEAEAKGTPPGHGEAGSSNS